MDTDKKTVLVFSDDLDKALAAFILANGAAAMGNDVTMFFAFWGVNLLRRPRGRRAAGSRAVAGVSSGNGGTAVPAMVGKLAARGPGHLRLSKWNFGGLGPVVIRRLMRRAKVMDLAELIATAREQEIRLVACTMSLDLFGLAESDLVDGVEFAGVATYFDYADEANVNLLI
ncbi:MAG: DsrE/DsrF/DrsH-like family protein [Kineosporiaceae bacterium]|jgi:peroxiredoxin family protein